MVDILGAKGIYFVSPDTGGVFLYDKNPDYRMDDLNVMIEDKTNGVLNEDGTFDYDSVYAPLNTGYQPN